MYTTIILAAVAATELFFLIWDLAAKTTHKKARAVTRASLSGIIAVLLAVGVLKGASRYIGIILLLALLALTAIPSLKKKGDTKPRAFGSVMRSVGVMLLSVMVMTSAILFPQYKPVKVTGSHAVSNVTYTWTDESREETYSDSGEKRRVTVEFYYPEDEGKYPFVVYSHGAGGTIQANYSTCTELASNGYVVCAIAHPYQAMFVTDTDGNTTIVDMEFMSAATGGSARYEPEKLFELYKEWMTIRQGDMNFVLDTALDNVKKSGDAPFDRIDPEHIGLFGHSLGGATSEIVGRTRDDIDAVIALEGTYLAEYTGVGENDFTYDESVEYPVPLLDVNSRLVYDQAADNNDPEYVNLYIVEHAADAREVIFNDAAHMNFCDLPLVSPPLAGMFGTGSVDARECIENVNDMVLEFFDHYLKGDPELDIPDEY